ncbi:MAG TPA: PGPGW domain-containing protein [Nocardioides sp.]|uniref:PGPGW domain-containing protein n=1 Tax=Nocardioides sp. TaxID=35761 RepID=UPI002E312B3C|nr:PGPGW domain-containing protein [Nocardioides sp.]HEX5090221.1 PGPGW domain-containing protein [Nocardioides sp.]
MKAAAKRIGLEIVGWLLVVAGIAALILPGPGLLMIAGGLIILSQQYEWAERRVEPIKREALKGAAKSVETWPRIVATSTMIALIAAAGVLWFMGPDTPGWWPLSDSLWLPGGKATGISQFLSALIALVLLVWSFRRYHGKPEAIAEVVAAAAADDDREGFWGQ